MTQLSQSGWIKSGPARELDQAIAINPQIAEALADRGDAYFARRDYAHAIVDYDEAIRFGRQTAKVFQSRGDVHEIQRDYVRAMADFDRGRA